MPPRKKAKEIFSDFKDAVKPKFALAVIILNIHGPFKSQVTFLHRD
jgi:hypothetical protein